MMRSTRGVMGRWGSIADTLKPIPGQTAGQLTLMNEISVHPEYDEETKRPKFRDEVMPKSPEHNYFATMYKWGFNSLTMFKRINEDPGEWYNANNTMLTSTFNQIGEIALSGLWSGVWRHTYNVGVFNATQGELLARCFGTRDKNGAVAFDSKETITTPPQRLIFPHTKEHEAHKRFKNPQLPNFKQIDGVHGKRVLREVQYHLGYGLRFYMVDGVFGSNPSTSTSFRVFTDNANHAYYASIFGLRNTNIFSQNEASLLKRGDKNPLEEMTWRRPGVVSYFAPGYDFEQPRIVEEFGGPRPQDLGLVNPKFVLLEPYSIPMKAIVGGDPNCDTLRDTVAFLCSRWGYYADDRKLLTLPSDSVLNKDQLTIVVNNEDDLSGIRSSAHLYGAFHHRMGPDTISRGWDATTRPAGGQTAYGDLIESSRKLVHSPLTVIHGDASTLPHRFTKRRRVGECGYKWPHNYAGNAVKGTPRPSVIPLTKTQIVLRVNEDVPLSKATGVEAGKVFAKIMSSSSNWLYANPQELADTFSSYCSSVPCYVVGGKDAKSVLDAISKNGVADLSGAKALPKGIVE
eukprot:PhF_6_TR25298/c0_g1_i1/m.34912